jgi:hypothetical protein
MLGSRSLNRFAVAGLSGGASKLDGGWGSSGHGLSTGTGRSGGVRQPASKVTAASVSSGQLRL